MGFLNTYPYTDFHELNLDWILKHFREFMKEVSDLEAWKSQHEKEYEQLKAFQDAIIAGNFPDSVKNAFIVWMQRNAESIIDAMVQNAFFGLTKTGYLVVYIPDSWEEITFGTSGLDDFPADVDFGHLTLSY